MEGVGSDPPAAEPPGNEGPGEEGRPPYDEPREPAQGGGGRGDDGGCGAVDGCDVLGFGAGAGEGCGALDGCDGGGCDLLVLATVLSGALRAGGLRAGGLRAGGLRAGRPAPTIVPEVMTPPPGARPEVRIALAALRFYKRRLSVRLPTRCRYQPSCSSYAAESIGRYGVVTGVRMARDRLRRCRPGGGRGVDPVPGC